MTLTQRGAEIRIGCAIKETRGALGEKRSTSGRLKKKKLEHFCSAIDFPVPTNERESNKNKRRIETILRSVMRATSTHTPATRSH